MTEDLRVDTGLVRDAGGRLQGIAADLPEPPGVHRPTGVDALSTAIAAKVTEVVDPVIAQMPLAKQALTQYAQNVISAAGTYDTADRQIAEETLKRVGEFDETFKGGGAMGGGSGGAGAASGAAQGAGATSPVAAAAQQGGQFGSMMQAPMQMAQQAAQAPMQMAGMAGAVPQAVQQAGQQAMQQVASLSEVAGEGGSTPDEASATESSEPQKDKAAPGDHTGERAPEAAAESPERTRPAEAGPEIAL
ncbi:type VII secretion target [Mycobacterium sp. B14F4]|uniref:type VII secretion target n=1 Tax=Mycobacterium sp. B14F4 TaxID=3153565 RepID=UPI00325F152E